MVVYLAGLSANFQLTWIDRAGRQRTKVGLPARHRGVTISRDGLSATVLRTDEGLRLYDLARDSEVRFSTEVSSGAGVWSPDGADILFGTTIDGVRGIYRKAANGSGREKLMLAGAENSRLPSDWRGGFLIYTEVDPKTRGDIWYVPDPGKADSKPVKFLGTTAIESQGQLSPDGRWLAYYSNETGRAEVYVREFPSGQGFAKVSVNGGSEPRWSKTGTELYFVHAGPNDKEMMVAAVQPDGRGGIKVAIPMVLFEFQATSIVQEQNSWLYSPHPDGQRFLVAVAAETAAPAIHLITNWRRLLKTGTKAEP